MDNETSFTQKIKEELCEQDYDEQRDKALLSAFIRLSGFIVFSGQEFKLILKTENNKVAKYIYTLIKRYYPDLSLSFTYRRVMKFNKPTQYLININDNNEELLKDLSIDFLDDKIPYNYTDKDNKVRGYFAGLFLCTGSCSNPISSNYHLEMYTNNEGFSNAILKLVKKIRDVDFGFKIIKRRNNYVVYLKRSDQISDFLAFINAYNSCLSFEDIRVNRDFANVSNRLINMDTYNFKKTIDKAEEQIKDINEIDRWLGIKNISNEKLRELCYLRKDNKEATYNDLANMLSKKLNITVSKSNVNHLFIKIKELAKGYRHEN